MMGQVLALFGFGSFADEIARTIVLYKRDITLLLESIMALFAEKNQVLIGSTIWFGIWYSMSSVLSRAMFSIFYVRYYLDIREDYHDEHSFIKKSLLIQSSHR
jgi:hypothetical protein